MIKKIIIIASVLVSLLAALIWKESRDADFISPPSGATNILTFLEVRPKYTLIRRFSSGGNIYLEVEGMEPHSVLRLGPPVYIFDGTGLLIDWCGDISDNNSFVGKWSILSNAAPISLEEVKQLLTKPTGAP